MGNGSPGGGVYLTAFDGLKNIQVVQDVFHAAIVGQLIEKRSNRFLCFHAGLLRKGVGLQAL